MPNKVSLSGRFSKPSIVNVSVSSSVCPPAGTALYSPSVFLTETDCISSFSNSKIGVETEAESDTDESPDDYFSESSSPVRTNTAYPPPATARAAAQAISVFMFFFIGFFSL